MSDVVVFKEDTQEIVSIVEVKEKWAINKIVLGKGLDVVICPKAIIRRDDSGKEYLINHHKRGGK